MSDDEGFLKECEQRAEHYREEGLVKVHPDRLIRLVAMVRERDEKLKIAVDALGDLAAQKTVNEMMEDATEEEFDGDMEGAYESMIDVARQALARIKGGA